MPKCDFNKVAKQPFRHGCSPVNLLHIFKTPFPRNNPGGLLLNPLTVHLKNQAPWTFLNLSLVLTKTREGFQRAPDI